LKKLYVSTYGISDWKGRLHDPEGNWKRGNSAFELAVSWELASKGCGIPGEILKVLEQKFTDVRLLLAAIEHPVHLKPEGSWRPSMNDLWCILNTSSGLVSMAVEGKAGEDFGDKMADWMSSASQRGSKKPQRPYAECRKGGGASSYNSDASKSLLLTEEVPHGRS